MTEIAAQLSLYPLGQDHLGPAIREAVAVLEAHGLRVRPGDMSTVVIGEETKIFEALREAFTGAAAHGPIVLTVTISNACPVPLASREQQPDEKD
jgi:uncharacterized protein YqgV (UPF0045/DUF77 family)